MNHFKSILLLFVAAMLILSACTPSPDTPPTTPSAAATEASTELPSSAAPDPTSPQTQFEAFYEEFKAAVSAKDMQFIDSILDDEVRTSFGGDLGKAYFHAHWENEKKNYGRDLWSVLEEIIALGGVYYQAGEYVPEFGECYVAPYTFLEPDFDIGGYRFCIEKKDSGWKLIWLIAGD